MDYSEIDLVQQLLSLLPLDSRQDKLEVDRLLLLMSFSLNELPPHNEIRQGAKEAGYRYLKVTVTDMDTGEALPPVYTMRQADNFSTLHTALRNAASWPAELLERLHTAPQNADGAPSRWYAARLLIDRQTRGGRRKVGMSDATKKGYDRLADWYYKTAEIEPDITEREFCRRANISRSRLTRALRHASRNRP